MDTYRTQCPEMRDTREREREKEAKSYWLVKTKSKTLIVMLSNLHDCNTSFYTLGMYVQPVCSLPSCYCTSMERAMFRHSSMPGMSSCRTHRSLHLRVIVPEDTEGLHMKYTHIIIGLLSNPTCYPQHSPSGFHDLGCLPSQKNIQKSKSNPTSWWEWRFSQRKDVRPAFPLHIKSLSALHLQMYCLNQIHNCSKWALKFLHLVLRSSWHKAYGEDSKRWHVRQSLSEGGIGYYSCSIRILLFSHSAAQDMDSSTLQNAQTHTDSHARCHTYVKPLTLACTREETGIAQQVFHTGHGGRETARRMEGERQQDGLVRHVY